MTRVAFETSTSDVTFACRDGFRMPAMLAAPQTKERRPGLLFIGEPFGLNAEMRRVAHEMAASGYVVLAPDLATRGSWFVCVRALMRALKAERGQGIDDLLAARDFLAGQPNVEHNRIAVMGLCMGGGFALILAKTGLFRVSAPFYGQTPGNMDGTCPIVASYGACDRMIAPHAKRLESELAHSAVPHDIKHYPGAGHSFLKRPPNRLMAIAGPLLPAHAGYDPQAAADAMARVLTFLEIHL